MDFDQIVLIFIAIANGLLYNIVGAVMLGVMWTPPLGHAFLFGILGLCLCLGSLLPYGCAILLIDRNM